MAYVTSGTVDRDRLAKLVADIRGEMSLREFSKRLDVSLGALQAWEEGRSIPGFDNLEKVAAAGGYTLEEVIAYLQGKPLSQPNDLENILSQIRYMPEGSFAAVVKTVGERMISSKCEGQ